MITMRDLYESPTDVAITNVVNVLVKTWGRRFVIAALYNHKTTTVSMLNVHIDNLYSTYGAVVIKGWTETYFKQTLQELKKTFPKNDKQEVS